MCVARPLWARGSRREPRGRSARQSGPRPSSTPHVCVRTGPPCGGRRQRTCVPGGPPYWEESAARQRVLMLGGSETEAPASLECVCATTVSPSDGYTPIPKGKTSVAENIRGV